MHFLKVKRKKTNSKKKENSAKSLFLYFRMDWLTPAQLGTSRKKINIENKTQFYLRTTQHRQQVKTMEIERSCEKN